MKQRQRILKMDNVTYQDFQKLHKLFAQCWQGTHPEVTEEGILCYASFNFPNNQANDPVTEGYA